jgi:hypothetical protein
MMDTALLKSVRREQSARNLEWIQQAIKSWLTERYNGDTDNFNNYAGRHKTQLEAVDSLLNGSLNMVRKSLTDLDQDDTMALGVFYDRCRRIDLAGTWLHQIWEYLRVKFDQRDHERLGPVVKAADEVVWGCYDQVFRWVESRNPNLNRHAPPLSYIENDYSPVSWEADRLLPTLLRFPAGLRAGDDVRLAALDAYLQRLPIPTVQLPSWCVDAPWWLVFVAHEVGHHVQHDLDLEDLFFERMRQAAENANLENSDVNAWGKWGEEIFADVFSVACMGTWAIWALTEIVWSTDTDMLCGDSRYPPPVTRLGLMVRVAEKLGLDGRAALHGFPLASLEAQPTTVAGEQATRTVRTSEAVDEAVKLALEPLPGNLGTITEMCGFRAQDYGELGDVKSKASKLLGTDDIPTINNSNVTIVRQVTAGGLRAWAQIVATTPANGGQIRAAKGATLAGRITCMLLASAPSGTRATPPGAIPNSGEELAQLLLDAAEGQL